MKLPRCSRPGAAPSSTHRASPDILGCRRRAFTWRQSMLVEGLTKAIALEFATQGIRVNSVAPGTIDTDMVDRLVSKEGDRRNWLLSLHPVGRFGASEEVAAAVLYLASEPAKFNTGPTLLVRGGWTAA